jgi:hypothetical protein
MNFSKETAELLDNDALAPFSDKKRGMQDTPTCLSITEIRVHFTLPVPPHCRL